MSNLPERFEESLRVRSLLRRGQSVLVGVSGGLDSMVLLHLLKEQSRKHAWKLTVAHLNHQLRGRNSDLDEQLVVRTARRLRLRVVVERIAVKEVASAHKISVEMAARKVRHDFFARTARRLKIPTIALAHHADDQVELFVLRLLRGTGSEGLAGMKWKSASPADPKLTVIRPLLQEPKTALRDYAGAIGLRHREDASNTSIDIQRNRVRHELLPLLRREYQPAFDRVVSRLMDIAGAEAEFVGEAAAEWLGDGSAIPFDKLPVAVQRRCIQLQLHRQKIRADYELVERLRTAPGRAVTVEPHRSARLDHGRLIVNAVPVSARRRTGVEPLKIGRAGKAVFGEVQIRWGVAPYRGSRPRRARAGRECFDGERVGETIVLRHWRPGDRFQPIGMSRPVKLQDLFTNQKIPRERRHQLVVAEAANGELFWVENLRISERFKLTGHTIRCLQWHWTRL